MNCGVNCGAAPALAQVYADIEAALLGGIDKQLGKVECAQAAVAEAEGEADQVSG